MDGLERLAVEPVQPLPPGVPDVDGPDLPQHPQVLGDLWLRQAEAAHQVIDRELALDEDVEDLPPPGLGHRVERVGRGRRPCHAAIVCPYRNVSSRGGVTGPAITPAPLAPDRTASGARPRRRPRSAPWRPSRTPGAPPRRCPCRGGRAPSAPRASPRRAPPRGA